VKSWLKFPLKIITGRIFFHCHFKLQKVQNNEVPNTEQFVESEEITMQ
jgi:hypothetical protein